MTTLCLTIQALNANLQDSTCRRIFVWGSQKVLQFIHSCQAFSPPCIHLQRGDFVLALMRAKPCSSWGDHYGIHVSCSSWYLQPLLWCNCWQDGIKPSLSTESEGCDHEKLLRQGLRHHSGPSWGLSSAKSPALNQLSMEYKSCKNCGGIAEHLV